NLSLTKISNDQLSEEAADESNMSFKYEGICNFEYNFDENIMENENAFSNENDTEEEENTVNFLSIISYFPSQETSTKKTLKPNAIQKKKKIGLLIVG
ncbi:5725_t:CDS:1, partial [Dentiscutata erythropus]